jgi:hypothetical protein
MASLPSEPIYAPSLAKILILLITRRRLASRWHQMGYPRASGSRPLSTFPLQIPTKRRADERTRTADLLITKARVLELQHRWRELEEVEERLDALEHLSW